MKEIKTKEYVNAQEVFETATDLGDRMRNGLKKAGNQARNLTDDGQVSSTEYAANNLQYAAEDLSYEAGHITVDTAKKTYQGARNIIDDIKECRNRPEMNPPVQSTVEKRTNINRPNPIPKRKNSINRTQLYKKTDVQQTVQTTKKGVIKTAQRTLKDSRRMEKAVQTATGNTIKTTKAAAKTARESARTTAEASRKTAWVVRRSIQLAIRAARAAAQIVVKAAKAVVAAVKSIAAVIAAGGWLILLVVAVIIVILVIIMAVLGDVDPTVPMP